MFYKKANKVKLSSLNNMFSNQQPIFLQFVVDDSIENEHN